MTFHTTGIGDIVSHLSESRHNTVLPTPVIILDAMIPYEWKDKPIPIEPDAELIQKVQARWQELGL